MMMTGTSMVHSALSRRRPALPHQFRELHQAHGRLLGHRQSVSEQQVARVIWLFFLAGLHGYVVFSLACLRGVIFYAGLLLIPTLLATARLFGSRCNSDATNTEQHNDNGSASWHDDLLSMLATAATRSSLLQVVFSSCCSLCLSRF